MIVSQRDDGRWIVSDANGITISEHGTNSHAWRAADRAANEPISKREDTADWAWRQALNAPARPNSRQRPGGAA